jgi:hypothetical protein
MTTTVDLPPNCIRMLVAAATLARAGGLLNLGALAQRLKITRPRTQYLIRLVITLAGPGAWPYVVVAQPYGRELSRKRIERRIAAYRRLRAWAISRGIVLEGSLQGWRHE